MILRGPDENDRRKQKIQIADEGERITMQNLEESLELTEKIRQRMGADQHDALLDLLNELERVEAEDRS